MSLKGKVIAITRPEKQAKELANQVHKLGGKPYIVPTIEIKAIQNTQEITSFCDRILHEKMDFTIFMSVNGVSILIKHSEKIGIKANFIERLNDSTIIAVGPKTGGELEKHGINVNLIPEKYSSRGIVKSLKKTKLNQKKIAIPRTKKPSKYLKQELEKMGAEVFEQPIYTGAPPSDHSKILRFIKHLLEGDIDVVTFTSSSTARNLFKIADEHSITEDLRNGLRKTLTVAIGPVTEQTLIDLGVRGCLVPERYTIDAMMMTLVEHLDHTSITK